MNRTQKILRNFLICLLLCLGIHAAMGFPPYTVAGMCRQVARDHLMEELEPIYVEKEKHKYSGDMFQRTYTYVIARGGEHYVAFLYDRNLLRNERHHAYDGEIGKELLCTARNGVLYVAGDFGDALSARSTVTATNGSEVRQYRLVGERLAEDLFAFVYSEEDYWWRVDDIPVEEMNLAQIARYWYRTPHGDNGYSYDHAELPVCVTLYDAAGTPSQLPEMSIGTYDLHLWW